MHGVVKGKISRQNKKMRTWLKANKNTRCHKATETEREEEERQNVESFHREINMLNLLC